ncbi:MAG: NERD domain-containing protein/DEAD/DEAH box helicase [Methylococcaceae bacterium]|nr:NERD domain-containing protein/DEAD/DEAH box helicase [Methylococcaceae bacterium]
MDIIPSHPYKTKSNAEYRLFKKLEEAFYNDHSYIAFHSLNLTHHKTKRFGEADFVILCKYGVFVLEVKGGGISYKEGNWFTINRNKQEFKIQDPFRQAEGAVHALDKKIREHFPSWCSIPIGYGVVFPDVTWKTSGSEWAPQAVCDEYKFRNIESWLTKFFRYWKEKNEKRKEFSTEQIKQLKAFFRPDFELVETLRSRIDKSTEQAVKLTEDQYKYLDIVVSNKRVLCSGGAGTGKTFLGAELARRLANEDKRVVFVCKSSWLRYYLQSQVTNQYVTISTIDSLSIDRKRAGIDKYDILIVDEGQDLFDFESIDSFENNLKGGLEQGEWYFFHDINNQAGLFIEIQADVLDLLDSYSPAKIPLTTNCRNTQPIINTIKDKLSLDMGSIGTGYGPEVEFLHEDDIDNPSAQLNTKINEIIKNGVSAQLITILSPHAYNDSGLRFLPEKLRKQIIELDDYSIRNFPIQNISFAEIKNFKGLENEVIIVIDLPRIEDKTIVSNKVLHYVAMTRARSLLCALSH